VEQAVRGYPAEVHSIIFIEGSFNLGITLFFSIDKLFHLQKHSRRVIRHWNGIQFARHYDAIFHQIGEIMYMIVHPRIVIDLVIY